MIKDLVIDGIVDMFRRGAVKGLRACLAKLGDDPDVRVAAVELQKRFMTEHGKGTRHIMTISSTVPSKWRFVDLEDGRIWRWDPIRQAYFERRVEEQWLDAHIGDLLVIAAGER